jgi:hypothetical protein
MLVPVKLVLRVSSKYPLIIKKFRRPSRQQPARL